MTGMGGKLSPSLNDRSYLLTVPQDFANWAVDVVRRMPHSLRIRPSQDVLLLNHDPSNFRQLVDAVMLHRRPPGA